MCGSMIIKVHVHEAKQKGGYRAEYFSANRSSLMIESHDHNKVRSNSHWLNNMEQYFARNLLGQLGSVNSDCFIHKQTIQIIKRGFNQNSCL